MAIRETLTSEGLEILDRSQLKVALFAFQSLSVALSDDKNRMTVPYGRDGQASRHHTMDRTDRLRIRLQRKLRNAGVGTLSTPTEVASDELPYLHLGLRLSRKHLLQSAAQLYFDNVVILESLCEDGVLLDALDPSHELGTNLSLSLEMLKAIDPITPVYRFNRIQAGKVT